MGSPALILGKGDRSPKDRLPLWQTVVSLSDFGKNPFWETVWNGTHVPYRVVFIFCLLQSICLWCQFIFYSSIFVGTPFLFPISNETFHDTHKAHKQCFDSLCREVQNASFSCYLDEHGTSKLNTTSVSGKGIRITEECRQAFLPDLLGSEALAVPDSYERFWFLRFPIGHYEQDFTFSLISSSCDIQVVEMSGLENRSESPSHYLDGLRMKIGQSFPLMGRQDSLSGYKTFKPNHLLCYDDMTVERQTMVDKATPVYEWLLKYYQPLLAFAVYPPIAFIMSTAPVVFTSFLRTLSLYILSSWFSDGTSFGSMFQVMCLLEMVLNPGWLGIVYLAVLAPIAYKSRGGDTTACLNWIFLFVASISEASYREALNSLLGNFNVLRFGVTFILWLTPGNGWSKVFGFLSMYRHVFAKPTSHQQETKID